MTYYQQGADHIARERARLARELDAHAHRERAIAAGTATRTMMRDAREARHLAAVLRGPRGNRGAVDLLLLVAVNVSACLLLAIGDAHARHIAERDGCRALYVRWFEAERAEEAARARYWRRAVDRNSCYVEEYYGDE